VIWFIVGLRICTAAPAVESCRIDVVEEGSGYPVPLVELRTNHHVRFVSDNAGVIAFDLRELMGTECWFFVEGHGYEVRPDGFGFRGVRLKPLPGQRLTVKVKRRLPAKRLGRITGSGIYGESQKLGLELDWREQGILGCDSTQTAVHKGRLYWAWGDTVLPGYPLGLFHMLGATTDLQPLGSFEPPIRLRYEYFTDESKRPRVICKMPGDGPTWLSGLVSLPDETGRPHLVAHYIKVQPPLTAYQSGLCVWDEAKEHFEQLRSLWTKTPELPELPPGPDGHAVFWTDDAGQEWVLFGDPFPRLKCAASFESWSDPANWQLLEPQANVPSVGRDQQIRPHRGSIAWNAYRSKWVAVFTQQYGKPSALGEIWYAEADQPTGPWGPAIKIVSHANYTFYNPCLHPGFTPAGSPILLFDGTYTQQFTDHAPATPRHDYNQILYRLDLNDPEFDKL
jgi:hypothetical protein